MTRIRISDSVTRSGALYIYHPALSCRGRSGGKDTREAVLDDNNKRTNCA